MRASSLFRPATAGFCSLARLWPFLVLSQSSTVNAITITPVALPDLDLAPLGRVALTGNFDAVSLYSYEQQTESLPSRNGSQALRTPLPNGVLATLSTADADILAMCPFTRKDGSFAGVMVGGNFTSLGGVESQGLALYNPATNSVESISGLTGTVSALLCDQDTDSVYVGGDFWVDNSTNAATWTPSQGLSSVPFGGFNGPVSSIVKADDGHIIFGGSFDGLGNETTTIQKNGSQVINLSTATITSDANSGRAGFDDPRNIICKTSDQDGPENTWLLADYSPGFWRADMRFGFRPTKLRLYNTHFEGRGTKTFLLQALPDTGIMNLTYTDPQTGQEVFCDSECPLSNNASEKYRDFRLVNNVGMSGFMIQIKDWYGQGAGLDGIELFQDDIYSYAVNDFNEPTCQGIEFPSTSTSTGSWTVTPAGQTDSEYLTADVTNADATSTSVTFEADIRQSGNYSVALYTPGCIQDGTCQSRGLVNVTGIFASSTREAAPLQTVIAQTNYFEKYDIIYTGYVEANSDKFRSKVTLAPLAGQGNLKVVALRVGFHLISATGGGDLNGLYEFDPTTTGADTNFSASAIDKVGTQLDKDASISSMVTYNGAIYAGGNFSDSTLRNIMSISDGNATSLPGGGLNAPVESLLVLNDTLYVGGNFTDTSTGGTPNLNYVAAYSFSEKSWSALGGGVNGPVTSVQSLPVNISADTTEMSVAVSGKFDQVRAFGDNSTISVPGFAVWVPSQKNWLQNLNTYQMAFNGQLAASAAIGNNTTILAGSLLSDGIASTGAVSLTEPNGLALEPFLVDIVKDTTSSSLSKRATGSQNTTGVTVGIFDKGNGRNLTILGGQFTARGTNGSTIENLLILNGANGNTVTGLGPGVDSNSTFLSLAVQGDTLFAGGTVSGKVGSSQLNGFVAYNLAGGDFVSPQPPALTGDNVTVNAIAVRPGSTEVYFGGDFDAAGALPCPSVCFYDTSEGQWNRPGVAIEGTVTSLQWASNNKLIAAGNLTVGNNKTMIATYDNSQQAWTSMDGASAPNIPGPVTAFGPAAQDMSQFWVAGQTSDGSSFLVNYDGSKFNNVGNLFEKPTTILGLQVLGLSQDHASTNLLRGDQVLLITGQLVIPDFGNASAALYNGTSLTPFLLSSTADGQAGSIYQLFTENQNTFSGTKKHHSTGIVVLISFCLALGCVFLIVVFGVILNKIQRRRQGYVRAPQTYATDRPTSMRRLPPEYLFDSLRQRHGGAPAI